MVNKILFFTPIIILSISCLSLFIGGIYFEYLWKKSISQLRSGGGLEVFERNLRKQDISRRAWLTFVSLATMVAQITFLLKMIEI